MVTAWNWNWDCAVHGARCTVHGARRRAAMGCAMAHGCAGRGINGQVVPAVEISISDKTGCRESEGDAWRCVMRHASRIPLLKLRVSRLSVSREWKLLLPARSACQLETEPLPDGNPIGRWSSPGGANTTGTHVMTAIR
jgi:hypothetical protein